MVRFKVVSLGFAAKVLPGPKPNGIKVETFRNDYLIRTPKG